MSKIKNISDFSREQLKEFFMSFDIVLSDIDGVIQYHATPIEGAVESMRKLQELGKNIYLVTNNSLYSSKDHYPLLELCPDNLINPIKVIIWYLKKINFHGDILAIVSNIAWKNLSEAGLHLVKPCTKNSRNAETIGETKEILKEVVDRPSIKAVIIDFDNNCSWPKLALAVSCLKRKDVLYIAGAMDDWIIANINNKISKILGPGPLVHLINTQSERVPLYCSKPSEILRDYLLNTCNIIDPQRCLFIGDSLKHDMKFASMCGFKKLFVGTGVDSVEQVEEEDDSCPDYYLSNLNQLFAAL